MRLLRLLTICVQRAFLRWLGWRALLITLVLNQAVTPLLGLAVWSAALPGAVQLLTVSYEHHTFANGIYAGALSHNLLRPHPVVLAVLGENVAMRIWHLLVGLPLIVVAGLVAGITIAPHSLLLTLPAVLFAAALRFLGYQWQVMWLAVLVIAAWLMWRSGVRRYVAVGG